MSSIVNVIPNNDYTLLIELEHGNKILFNMQRLIKTILYSSLKDIECFKNIKVEDKTILWRNVDDSKPCIFPVMLTLDNILLMLRD